LLFELLVLLSLLVALVIAFAAWWTRKTEGRFPSVQQVAKMATWRFYLSTFLVSFSLVTAFLILVLRQEAVFSILLSAILIGMSTWELRKYLRSRKEAP